MDPLPFTHALLSPAPHADIPDDQRIFEPFIGSWVLDVRWYGPGEELQRQEEGEWHFARVLEGRGIQDVWIVPPRGRRKAGAYEYGTSLRFHDPALGAWRSTWVGPMHGAVLTFTARRNGDAVVLETTPDVAPARRWSFRDITPSAFTWVHEAREGGEWRLVQSFAARRMVA